MPGSVVARDLKTKPGAGGHQGPRCRQLRKEREADQLDKPENICDTNKTAANQVMERASRPLGIDERLVNMKLCSI